MSGGARRAPGRRLSALSAAVLILIALLSAYAADPLPFEIVAENTMMTLSPSASRAFAYGARHFDAERSSEYDLARAERMFRTAARLDPTTPYVYHELARIEFLRGNFETALQLIDHEIETAGDSNPNAYYVRGLIEGYMGKYADAANDYAAYLSTDPNNWAAINDYSWILLKAGRSQDALAALSHGVIIHPDNPWLLNSYSIALYETGDIAGAREAASSAVAAANTVTQAQWLHAYPGNDPDVAAQGIAALRRAALDNMNRVERAATSSALE